MDPEDPGNRLQICTALALTVVAFQFAVTDRLPRVNYLTALDTYFILAFVFIALSVMESILAYKLAEHGHRSKADFLDIITFCFSSCMLVSLSAHMLKKGYARRANADLSQDGVLDSNEVRMWHRRESETYGSLPSERLALKTPVSGYHTSQAEPCS